MLAVKTPFPILLSILFFICLVCCMQGFSQSVAPGGSDVSISGKVIDAKTKEPLTGVSVVLRGGEKGVTTNKDGYFSLRTRRSGNVVLQFSMVGFAGVDVDFTTKNNQIVELTKNAADIGEVVVIGYGSSKKKDLTGSVSVVTTKALESVPAYDLTQALKGREAGVRVMSNSGAPNSRVEVQIRGGNSMIGNNSPLYVVDGFPITGGIQYLNPSDIESMNILKDASSTAIYGSRGANGVVIITTKRGRKDQKGRIDLDSYYGTQEAIKKYDLLNAKEYATVANEWAKNGGVTPTFDLDQVQNPGTDWQSYVFRTGQLQNHTLTFSGGGNKTRYSLSGNFYDQQGILINNSIKRGSIKLNLDHEVNSRVTLGANITLSRREGYSTPVDNSLGGLITLSLAAPPTLPVRDANGLLTRTDQVYAFGNNDYYNPLMQAAPYRNRFVATGGLVNGSVDIKILEGLKFRSQEGLEFNGQINDGFTPIIWPGDLGAAYDGYSNTNSFLTENTFNYTKTVGQHSFNAVAGVTYQSYTSRSENANVRGLSTNITENYNLSSASIIDVPTNDISQWNMLSLLGRVNYTLSNKYLFTASIRRDGSSRFGANNKWGTFPSGAFAWRISNEEFMKSVNFINDLKLRTSYGITGSTALNPYQTIDRLNSNRVVTGNNTSVVGYSTAGIANPDLKWETTAQFDVGLDAAILNNRINFTFDYYKKNTHDLLATVGLPPSVGFSSVLQNTGEIQNHGFEFMVDADVVKSNFKWTIGAQVSVNRNKVMKLAGGSDLFGAGNGLPFNTTINIGTVGQPLGVFYGYLENGLDANGQIKYVDVDKNGVINALDRVILGNPYPKFTYGFSNTMHYRNFDLDFFWEGSQGNDVFWETAGIHLNSFQRGANQFHDLIGNYWTADKPDPNAKYPKIGAATQFQVSNRFVKDGSYLRLKSARLAYNIPVSKSKWIGAAQVYVTGSNLITITQYPGLDPDVNVAGSDSQNIGTRLMVGIDKSPFPLARAFAFGIKASF
jgi:TonB-linked SusC/RagA family outer membrane protein